MAVTRGGKGGGFAAEDAVSTPGLITDGKSYEGLKTKPSKARPVSTRLRSMYVFMNLFHFPPDIFKSQHTFVPYVNCY